MKIKIFKNIKFWECKCMDLQLTKFIKGMFIVLFTLLTLPFLSDFF